MIEKHKLFI